MAEVLARLSSRAIALSLGALLLVAACSTGGSSSNQSASSTDVTVWTAWGGAELKAFRDVLAPFQSSTGRMTITNASVAACLPTGRSEAGR